VALSDSLRFTLGTKLEHKRLQRFRGATQRAPGLARQRPADVVGGHLARSARADAPGARHRHRNLPPGSNPTAMLLGNGDFESEELIAYEAGYRWHARDRLSFDLATFYNDYDKLASLELGDAFVDPDGRTVFPIVNENLTRGRTYGAELQAEWEPVDDWRLTANYSYIDMELTAAGQDNNRGVWLEDSTPRNMAGLRSFYTMAISTSMRKLRYQSDIGRQPMDVTGAGIAAYTEFDLRLAGAPRANGRSRWWARTCCTTTTSSSVLPNSAAPSSAPPISGRAGATDRRWLPFILLTGLQGRRDSSPYSGAASRPAPHRPPSTR
jgi:iron complex outermembrane receptor protein